MTHVDVTFTDSTIRVDGNTYDKCKFMGCRIEFAGVALPRVNGCHFSRCTFDLVDSARMTIDYLNSLYNGLTDGPTVVEGFIASIRKKRPAQGSN